MAQGHLATPPPPKGKRNEAEESSAACHTRRADGETHQRRAACRRDQGTPERATNEGPSNGGASNNARARVATNKAGTRGEEPKLMPPLANRGGLSVHPRATENKSAAHAQTRSLVYI